MQINNLQNFVSASIIAVVHVGEEVKNRMQIMANLIIDRFIQNRRFGSLQSDKMSFTMDPKMNYGT